jgi:hypothetical protein
MASRYWFQSLNCGRILGAARDGSLVLCTLKHGHKGKCPQPAADLQPIRNGSSEPFNREIFRALCAERWRV